ncbi:MAG: BrnT family toxin [Hydrococcus sp. C42_A2020_068]|nr:BrnT family toxin [Hydrococcus sp. C42_A2020_068]
MAFEFDENKSRSNKEKHSIDFEEAQAIFQDLDRIEIPAKVIDEPRFLVIGKIGRKHWSAIITYRAENIRIISVRRARTEEVELYESK